MTGIVRDNVDTHEGHDGPNAPYHKTYYNTGSPNVFANNEKVVRKGDKTLCGDAAVGASSNVFANGIALHRNGDATSGHGNWQPSKAISGSPYVFVNT